MRRAYRIALVCGALPLVVGFSIFLLWVVTRRDSLMLTGVYTVFGGLACFVAGAIALVRFWWLGSRVPDMPRPRLLRATLACAALLLSNFPAAGAILYAAVAIETCYTVELRNDSGAPLENVRVTGAGSDVSFGTVQPGESSRRGLWATREGNFVLEIRGKEAVPVSGYVCSGMGGRATATVRPDGTVVVDER